MINANDIYGIYQVKEILDKKSNDGHRLYLVECAHCHKQFELAANSFAYKSTIITKCRHLTKEELKISSLNK